jgi:hypothetical protein
MDEKTKNILLYSLLALCFFSAGGSIGYLAGKSARPVPASLPIAATVERQQQGVRESVETITGEVLELGNRLTETFGTLDAATSNSDELKQRINTSLDIIDRNTIQLEYLDIILRQLAEREGYTIATTSEGKR